MLGVILMADVKTTLKTVWNGNIKGSGSIKATYLDTALAIPVNLGGTGEGSEPKEMLIASATTCFTMTLTGMLQMKKLPVDQILVDTESTNSKEDGFKINHSCQIVLSADATEEQVQAATAMIALADKNCAVGNMLRKADVQIEAAGEVTVA